MSDNVIQFRGRHAKLSTMDASDTMAPRPCTRCGQVVGDRARGSGLFLICPEHLAVLVDQVHLLAGEAPDRPIGVVTVLGIVRKPFVRMKARIGAEEHYARHGST